MAWAEAGAAGRPGALPLAAGFAGLLTRVARLSIANQFLLAASVVVFVLMGGMGYIAAWQVERAVLRAAGASGAVSMQTLVAPLVRRDAAGGFVWDDAFRAGMTALIGHGPKGQRITNLKVWLADGTVIFSARPGRGGPPVVFPELAAALAGETTISRSAAKKPPHTAAEKAESALAIYAPLIIDPGDKVVLVGEIYLESVTLERAIAAARRTAMMTAGLVCVPMLSLLYLIVWRGSRLIDAQRRSLRRGLQEAVALSNENSRLKAVADGALLEAGKLGEKVLDQIGADLHDGALQVLTLVKLKLSDLAGGAADTPGWQPAVRRTAELVSAVLEELRNFSAGLILPELEGVGAPEAIELARKRYLEITGCEVALLRAGGAVPDLPHLSICLYRFVLEGLLNSYRHARGNRQLIRYGARGGRLYVSVVDIGAPPLPYTGKERDRVRLGRVSQKRRIQSFGGRMRHLARADGLVAIASLPLAASVDGGFGIGALGAEPVPDGDDELDAVAHVQLVEK